MKVTGNLTGLDRVRSRIQRYPDQLTAALAFGIQAEAQATLRDAVPLVPVDTGALRKSGFAEHPVVNGERVTVKLGFGGASAGYARIVHDGPEIWGLTPGTGSRVENNRRAVERSLAYRKRLGIRGKGRVRLRKFVGQSGYLSTVIEKRRDGLAARVAALARGKLLRLRGGA